MKNLDRAIRWSYRRLTDNWCSPLDRETGGGCQYWREPDKPPALEKCRRCEVHQFFCRGCAQETSCRIFHLPKIFPRVSIFLNRTNVAQRFGLKAFDGSVDDLSIRTWRYLQKASQVQIEEDYNQKREMEEKIQAQAAGRSR